MFTTGLSTLKEMQVAFVSGISNCVTENAEPWETVRKLALEIDGRRGYCDRLRQAYEIGRWSLIVPGHPFKYYINLVEPMIVKADFEPIDMEDAYNLGGMDLKEIDVCSIIHSMADDYNLGIDLNVTQMTEMQRDAYARAGGFPRLIFSK